MLKPKISLDQWTAFIAVVEYDGYARAAEQIHKTQSSVSYSVQKIEQLLGLKLFSKQGRRSILTPAGEVLYRRAKNILERAEAVELGATHLGGEWEPELRIAVETIFPTWLLLKALNSFSQEFPQTQVQLYETVLGGTDEALYERQVDLAITSHIPQGFVGDPLLRTRFVAAAHPDHPLNNLGREITLDDLREHRHLVIRDSGVHRSRHSGGWFGAEQRWTVTNKATHLAAACQGMGFAWFPVNSISNELEEGQLVPLPLREGGERFSDIYLTYSDPDFPSPCSVRIADLIRQYVSQLEEPCT